MHAIVRAVSMDSLGSKINCDRFIHSNIAQARTHTLMKLVMQLQIKDVTVISTA